MTREHPGELEHINAELQEVIAINQCAEDSATEKHVKAALGVVNGYLLNIVRELDYMKARMEGAEV